jgi:hypothetical protein
MENKRRMKSHFSIPLFPAALGMLILASIAGCGSRSNSTFDGRTSGAQNSGGRTQATLSTVGFCVGLANLAAAGWLRSPVSEPSRAWVAPWGGPSRAGLAGGHLE